MPSAHLGVEASSAEDSRGSLGVKCTVYRVQGPLPPESKRM